MFSMKSPIRMRLEGERHTIANTPVWSSGQVFIGETLDPFYAEELEDVVHTHHHFGVGMIEGHEVYAFREIHQSLIASILRQVGVILVREFAPEHAQSQILAPVEFLGQGDAVVISADSE